MIFIKRNPLGLILCVLSAVMLAACSSVPQQNTAEVSESSEKNRVPKTTKIPAGATQAYEKVLVAIDAQQWQTAEVLLQELQADYPRLLALRASLGWVYWQSGQLDRAVEELETLVDKPRLAEADAHNILAIIYREQGKFDEAEALYQRAIQRWPNSAVLHRNLGVLYELYLGRLTDALAHYQQAQQLRAKKDKRLASWIKDLERRTNTKQKGS